MLTFEQAEALAKAWVDVTCKGEASVISEQTMQRPYGWVFFYQSKKYLATQQVTDALIGNVPIIIARVDGEIRVTGTTQPIESYLAEYEATLPAAKLMMEGESTRKQSTPRR